MEHTLRHASLDDMVAMLRDQHARRVDVVAPAAALTAKWGSLVIAGTEPVIEDDGVTMADGTYYPTKVCVDGLASRLNIPVGYLRRLSINRPDLFDDNVNGWLHGTQAGAPEHHADPSTDKYLIRCLRGDDGQPGIARAVLSDSYLMIDNLDVLMAVLEGVREAGVPVNLDPTCCHLGDEKMHVTVWSDAVKAMAPALLERYRSPFEGQDAPRRAGWDLRAALAAAEREGQGYDGDEPIINAGFLFQNSEVGLGRFTITPRMRVRACKNGLIVDENIVARQHLGVKLDVGVVKWGAATVSKTLELIKAQTADAVRTFLDVEYLKAKITELERTAGAPVRDPAEMVKLVSKNLRYSDERQTQILEMFTRGGQMTAAGMMNAVTAAAQTIEDPDEAFAVEADGVKAMRLVASLAG